jgi:hypothetical protein
LRWRNLRHALGDERIPRHPLRLTAGIAEQIACIVEILEQQTPVDDNLETLVATLFQNLALFRS